MAGLLAGRAHAFFTGRKPARAVSHRCGGLLRAATALALGAACGCLALHVHFCWPAHT